MSTPNIRLAPRELLQLFLVLSILSGSLIKLMVTNRPWDVFGSHSRRRDYWRAVVLRMVQLGGHRFSIRHLQYIMPKTRTMIAVWGYLSRVGVVSEKVPVSKASDQPNAFIHWYGPQPSASSEDQKILLFFHGGGYILPLSHGHILMMTWFRKQLLARSDQTTPIYLGFIEYTIAPYGRYPTQVDQCIDVLNYLMGEKGFIQSQIILAGDSAGAGICVSALFQILTPSPSLATPLSVLQTTPFAGLLLVSPWTSFATTSPSYSENATRDILSPLTIRRFRDTYLTGTALLPQYSFSAMDFASMSGDEFTQTADPSIPGLQDGAGAVYSLAARHLQPWKRFHLIVSNILITRGKLECFRDDIAAFEDTIAHSTSSIRVESYLDDSYHASIISDFAFGIPPGNLANFILDWLVDK